MVDHIDEMRLRAQTGLKKRWVGPDGDYIVLEQGKNQAVDEGMDGRNITDNKQGSRFLKIKAIARNKGKKNHIE